MTSLPFIALNLEELIEVAQDLRALTSTMRYASLPEAVAEAIDAAHLALWHLGDPKWVGVPVILVESEESVMRQPTAAPAADNFFTRKPLIKKEWS